MLHVLQWLYTYVAKVCYQCFICVFGRILQVCLSRYCIYFTHMLQLFYLDVAYVCNGFRCFFQVFQKYVSSIFFYMLMLYLDVSKVDRVSTADLHLVGVSRLHGG
jgi:hypothetical protein